ncbi:MAG TPA: PLD nuclease N-terminal domain-containing protein [Terrimesophilobacter sp.]|nr:PLD nuclease N-terminal domain-containing protein [Terrimesophilobacter sp.]HRP99076.1 PLD nuclease N-terminal domain-containing protein [Terrimesophilobacter sp.]
MPVVISVVIFLAMLAALFDVITRDDSQIKGLPKIVWLLLIVFIPVAGSILWFVAGREPKASAYRSPNHPSRSAHTGPALFDRSGTRSAALPPHSLSTEEQLAALEREIAEQAELDRIRQLEAEIEERRRTDSD